MQDQAEKEREDLCSTLSHGIIVRYIKEHGHFIFGVPPCVLHPFFIGCQLKL